MIRALCSLLILLGLAACGADGEPPQPTFSGSATVGVNSESGGFMRNRYELGLRL